MLDDVRDLLNTGFNSLDAALSRVPDERLIHHLVEMWLMCFTTMLPYLQGVFLPLDLELAGNGTILSHRQAQESFGSDSTDIRCLTLIAFRDKIIISRFDTLKQIFSRLSLESLSLPFPVGPSSSHSTNYPDNRSASPSDSHGRPGTAMSHDPSLASYSSNTSTLINVAASVSSGGSMGSSAFPPFAPGGNSGSRSRAISNTSVRSDGPLPPPPSRPFTPGSTHGQLNVFGLRGQANAARDRHFLVEDSGNRLTETVGRMLQCMSVLASLGSNAEAHEQDKERDEQSKMEELNRALKLNWLGRGRTGRNRRGLVGARVPGVGI